MLQQAVDYGGPLEAKSLLSPAGAALLLEYWGRQVMLKKKDYRKNYIESLMQFCKVRYLKPQRMLQLSFAEEQIRCRLTWMQYDNRMWDLEFGGP